MKKTISDDYGIVVLTDAGAGLSFDLAPESAWRKPLDTAAKSGRIFFIDREDPIVDLKVELVTEPVTHETHPHCVKQTGGSFLLHAPSGRLVLSGLGNWQEAAKNGPVFEVAPGSYNVIVHSHEDLDYEAYKEDMANLIGETEYRYVGNVDRLSFLGCLPTLFAIGVIVFAPWKVGLAAGAVAAMLWLPNLIGGRTARYRRAQQKIEQFERNLPLFVLQLNRVESTSGLVGGSVS